MKRMLTLLAALMSLLGTSPAFANTAEIKLLEAQRLGFTSVQEMKEIHSKGWHTKERYEEDLAKQQGYSSASEMRAAIGAKEREEDEAKQKGFSSVEEMKAAIAEKEKEEHLKRIADRLPEKTPFNYYRDSSCKENCLSEPEAEIICKQSKGFTNRAFQVLGVLADSKSKALLTGGTLRESAVIWNDEKCIARLSFVGLYQGTSSEATFIGLAKTFVKVDGKILVHYIDLYGK